MDRQSAKVQGAPALVPGRTRELESAHPPDPRAVRGAAIAVALAALPVLAAAVLPRGTNLVPRDVFFVLHGGVETLGLLAAFAIFTVQWHIAGTQGLEDARARFLGVSFLGVAVVETAHLLSLPGMPPGTYGLLRLLSADQGLFYGVIARLWTAGALLGAAFVTPHSAGWWLRRPRLLGATTAIALALLAAGAALPRATLFHVGRGETPLGTSLSAAAAAVSVLAAVLHGWTYRRTGDPSSLRLATALVLGAFAGGCFLRYGEILDPRFLLGTAYQAASSWFVFGALFAAAVVRPYERLDTTLAELSASHVNLARLEQRVEGELHQTVARLEAAIAAVPNGLVIYARDGSILRLNAAADAMLGYPPGVKEWPLEARWRSLRPETRDGRPIPVERAPVTQALEGESVVGQLVLIHPPKRKPLWISMSAAPIRGPAGTPLGAVVSMTDTSALQALEGQQEDLLRAMSHDLRSPLQIILLQAERLQGLLGADPSSRARGAADTIASTTLQLDAMMRDLVESARLEAGLLRLAPEPVHLAPFAAQLLARAGLADAGRVRLEIPERLPPVAADPTRLDRIFRNVVSNALKFSSPPAEVRVGAAEAFGDVVVSVTDHGRGIAPEDLPRIFERFYRGSASRQSGLGLGLYVARLLVEAHGGSIWADSRPGEGSTVTFTLPQARGDATA